MLKLARADTEEMPSWQPRKKPGNFVDTDFHRCMVTWTRSHASCYDRSPITSRTRPRSHTRCTSSPQSSNGTVERKLGQGDHCRWHAQGNLHHGAARGGKDHDNWSCRKAHYSIAILNCIFSQTPRATKNETQREFILPQKLLIP